MDLATDVGVVPYRAWEMSPAELYDHVAVHQAREKLEWERAAWMVHHIMSAFIGSKKTPSIDRLLGRSEEVG